ncbi:bifunctional (p)ppGpp synthetase/guanosine-3',5'-bis(diphosphate) 3'-pyrophosphohydrolase [Micrococcus sp.]|uniref:RelA/SpoT family protein n=1 Tax=Micrococcus sp. TaxID=1271 RepID=UPI002A91AED6|nr:bifunctional (p)ppGpp synthetase/guanosine-3',5'-bis(diphosphate) 3'-pyrophosphohydrolase [Micrococcus sp.]MDY6055485.1 bifunctional (p)ppGpp synthetase/guanosine-3',5'-bis(diphosphate) 3'-pyrophosphohydrolase [Micrococcus sp.]
MSDQDQRPSAAPARRGRMARLTGRRATEYSPLLEPLMRTVRQRATSAELKELVRAFEVADRAHSGQTRRSGDPYITHPVAVATILAELGVTGPTLLAALLHDTVEDTDYSLEQLTEDFGPEVALLVDGVTKLDKVTYGAAAQAETVRKMIIAMAQDVNVLLIKLADRLHNARTWRYVSPESSAKKARETLDIYAPLAHRLGMNTVKWELEDLSFAALKPKVYAEIVRLVGERNPEREKQLRTLRGVIEDQLKENRIRATVTGRPKHYYSIYQKMVTQGKDFDDIYDLTGIRVLVDTVRDCYGVLGVVHSRWNPVPGRFKDYIAVPKLNMYRSLHTTVMGSDGKPVEIQIRTWEMHRQAEFGVAAHWRYKAVARGEANAAPAAATPQWLRSVMDWQKDTRDPDEFLASLRTQIGADEVYVFTPRGEIRALPAGSTPVDFAYSIHTDVGHRTVGAKVNGRLVPLSTPLSHGDTVEVLTSKAEHAGPSRDWLGFVVSPRARSKIRHHFATQRRDEQIERGRESLTRQLRRAGMPVQRVLGGDELVAVAEELGLKDVDALFASVGDGHTSAQAVAERLEQRLAPPPAPTAETDGPAAAGEVDLESLVSTPGRRAPARASNEAGVLVAGDGGVLAKLARCCNPVPPDEIVGFVTRGSGVSVHRAQCRNLATMVAGEPERRVEVSWAPSRDTVYLVEIQVEALDRTSLLSDVTRVLSENHVNILSASVNTTRDRVAMSRFVFEMGDPLFLSHVVNAVRRIDGVFDVHRI